LTSNLYYEDRDKLDAFLIQVNVYVRTYKKLSSSHDKILFAFSYFRRNVFKWFKSLMKNHLKNKSEDQEDKINRVFENFSNFEQAIQRMYEDINAKWIIERQLYGIKQSESAFKYIAAFQSIAAEIKWDDSTFTAQFYKELKNVTKNKIIHMNKLTTLHAMISKTIMLNNQQYERKLEKKNKIAYVSVAWSKRKKKQSYYDAQSMKLDATQKISTNARDKTIQQSKACYTCKKLNHFFRDYTQNKYKNKSKLYNKQDKSFAATKEDQKDKHQALSWTACYEDNCCTHLNDIWNSYERIISTQQFIISRKCMMRKVTKVRSLWSWNQRFSIAKNMTWIDWTARKKLFIKQSRKKIDLAKFYEHSLSRQKMLSKKKKIVLK